MSTNQSSASTATPWPQLLSQDQYAKLSIAFDFAIIPCVSAVGICGNVMSMFLLASRGFRKSSRVLLFVLALADLLFLAGLNNFSRHVLTGKVSVGFALTENVNYMFYIFYMMLLGAHYIGLYCSILIPVLITGDRLVVVFLPLKAHTIVTPLSTLLVISCVCISVVGCFVYQYVLCVRFEQIHLVGGVLLGRIVATDRLYQDHRSGVYALFIDTLNHLTGVVPIAFVTLGCAVIGLKVNIVTRKRRQLTSGGVASNNKSRLKKVISKSSKMLLIICALYVSCRSFELIVYYVSTIPDILREKYIVILLESLNRLNQCINSVGNFIIYVQSNNNFRYNDLQIVRFVKSLCDRCQDC